MDREFSKPKAVNDTSSGSSMVSRSFTKSPTPWELQVSRGLKVSGYFSITFHVRFMTLQYIFIMSIVS